MFIVKASKFTTEKVKIMNAPLKAGAVAVEFIGQDQNFMEAIKRIERGVNGLAGKIRAASAAVPRLATS